MSAIEEVNEITNAISGIDGDIKAIEDELAEKVAALDELKANREALVVALKDKVAEI